MPNTVRIKLQPIPLPRTLSGEEDRANVVTGVDLSLENRGTGSTAGTADPQPAQIVFHLATFKRVRTEEPSFSRLAELTGQLLLSGAERIPVFTADKGPDGKAIPLVYDDPALNVGESPSAETPAVDAQSPAPAPEQASGKPRMLELSFSALHFKDMLDADAQNQRLLLPDAVNEAHYVEVAAELLVAGAAEGPMEANDILDVRITDQAPLEAPHYELRLVDEVGESLAGVEFVLREQGTEHRLLTDGEGRAFKLAASTGGARVEFASPDQLKQVLKARWAKARGKPRFDPGPEAITLTPRDLEEAVEVSTEVARLVCVRPHVVLARLQGMFFDTNKSFLLPSALPRLPELRDLYAANPGGKLLIVGHTDTTGEPSVNDPLSLERADSLLAYLKDDRQTWLKRYQTSIPEQRRWGRSEDLLMLRAVPGFVPKENETEEIEDFQAAHGLEVDGILGPDTREKLIEVYMDRDDTSLPEDLSSTTHGCGENFPIDDENEELDVLPADEKAELGDRRVELFFFDGELGIQPAPPGKNSKAGSTEYPEWRRRSDAIRTLQLNTRTVRLFLLDSRYQRMKNCVFELLAGGIARRGLSNDQGLIEEFEVPITERCELRWGELTSSFGPAAPEDPMAALQSDEKSFEYFNVLNLKVKEEVDNDLRLRAEARARLDNLGERTGRFNGDYRTHRTRYELSPVDAPFDRPGFDELSQIHREGVEAPLTEAAPFGPDTDPELFELDGEEAVELLILDDRGEPVSGQLVSIGTEAGVIRTATTNEQGVAAVRGIETGAFSVSFPGFDADAFQVVLDEGSNG